MVDDTRLPPIVGISGKKRHGKDAAAEALLDLGYECHAMADPIKTIAREVFGLNDSQLYGGLKETVDPFWDLSSRQIQQIIGTDAFRTHFGEDVWCKSLEHRVILLHQGPRLVSIPDIRFPNEVRLVHRYGGIVLRIIRPSYAESVSRWKRVLCRWMPSLTLFFGTQYHPSETSLDDYQDFDATIINNGTLDQLQQTVRHVVKTLTGPNSESYRGGTAVAGLCDDESSNHFHPKAPAPVGRGVDGHRDLPGLPSRHAGEPR